MISEAPRSIVHFSFGYHTEETVPLMGKIEADLRNFFESQPDYRRVYFEEVLGGSETRLKSFRKIKKPGISFLDANLQEAMRREMGLKPYDYDPNPMKNRFTTDPKNAFKVALFKVLDSVEQDFEFEYNAEATTPQEAKLLTARFDQAMNLYTVATNSAVRGDPLNKVLKEYGKSLRLISVVQDQRNARICERIVEELKTDNRSNRASLIFVRLGECHDTTFDRLNQMMARSKRLMPPLVEVVYDYGEQCLVFNELLYQKLERSPRYTPTHGELISGFVSSVVEFHLRVAKKQERPLRAKLDREILAGADRDDMLTLIANLPDPNVYDVVENFITSITS